MEGRERKCTATVRLKNGALCRQLKSYKPSGAFLTSLFLAIYISRRLLVSSAGETGWWREMR